MQQTKKRFLGIGINYYGTSSQLSGCQTDIDDMETYLHERGYTTYATLRDHVDDPTFQAEHAPTTANILKFTSEFIASLVPGDYGLIQYSGHGAQVDDTNGDEVDGKDECIIPVDYESAGVIIDDTLKILIVDAVKAGVHLRVIFDCCHSGSTLDLPFNWKAGTQFLIENRAKLTDKDKDIIFICACKNEQVASDATFGGRPNGALTWALIKTLRTLPADTRWRELGESVRRTIKRRDFDQVPSISVMKQSQILSKVDI